jgi:protein TonB
VNLRAVNLSVVIALHAAIIAALLVYGPTRRALAQAAPVFVRFIDLEAPKLEAPPAPPKRTEPDKPRPVEKPRAVAKPKPQAPVITAAPSQTAPPTFEAPPAPPKPEPATDAAAAPSPPAQVAAAAPAPVVPPSFNADYLHNPAPAYPSLSRRLGEEGRVVLRVFVSTDGHAERVEMRSSSGHARLDEVALETVRKWKFVPAKQGDKPVAAWVLVPISFSLRG